MKVFEAPNKVILEENDITCFLAGGITGCEDWQTKVIDVLSKKDGTENLVLLNPRRKNFDVTNPNAAKEQITWEFNELNNMDIFSMYFSNSDSVQPICMYELGRHLERIPKKFVNDWENRIIIGVESGYSRTNDVFIQSRLVLTRDDYKLEIVTPEEHAENIYNSYLSIRKSFIL